MSPLSLHELETLEEKLRVANDRLASEATVPRDIEQLVQTLSLQVSQMPTTETLRVDPYLWVALQQGLISALRAGGLRSKKTKRKELRIALEQMRQAVRDIVEGIPVSDDQPSKDIVRWLVETLDVPQNEIASLLDVSPRTFQRWASPGDPTAPHNEDALKVRLLGRLTNHLRHAFSGPGVVAWLERPHPELKGDPPKQLLDKRQTFERLTTLAASARSSSAT